ncbi:MAG: hypothetical protein QXP31_00055 [Pyrobaculum sp.]
MRWLVVVGLVAALALAANVTYVATPSGNIHITYQDNGTFIVINFNKNKTLTINVKLNVTNATDLYYIHVVGKAVGPFTNTTAARIASVINMLRNATTQQQVLTALRQLGAVLTTANETKELKLKAFITARSLNSTSYNGTWLRAKIEYELERKFRRINGTLVATPKTELEIKGFAADLSKLSSVLRALAARLAPYDNKTASALLYLSQNLSNVTDKLKVVVNGTVIKVEKKGNKFEIEVKSGDERKSSEEKRKGEEKSKEVDEKKQKEDKSESNKSSSDDSASKSDKKDSSNKSEKKDGSGGGKSDKDESDDDKEKGKSGEKSSGKEKKDK